MSYQAYLDNIQKQTGVTPQQFIDMAKEKNLTKFAEIIDWLKTENKLGLGHARAIAGLILHPEKFGFAITDGSSLKKAKK